MKLIRLTTLSLLATLALAACGGDKVQPDGEGADSAMTDEQRVAKNAEEYKKRQAVFADSVLGNARSVTDVAKSYGKGVEVGSVQLRDSLMKYVETVPQCFKNARDMDPYLAGTVTFYIHMSVVGSDVVRVQTSEWTSQAGNMAEKCLNDAATKWKFPMGVAKEGQYVLQVQFK
ncbi:MAG: hypothetical protein Q8K82_10750 [Gemmatimonadaceae bacterium]|nr:hypothetical protein [Gemmatimonadaceae bacterium]